MTSARNISRELLDHWACSSAFIFSRFAIALRMMIGIAVAASTLGGIGYLVWKAL
jgi:hypothetical protein